MNVNRPVTHREAGRCLKLLIGKGSLSNLTTRFSALKAG